MASFASIRSCEPPHLACWLRVTSRACRSLSTSPPEAAAWPPATRFAEQPESLDLTALPRIVFTTPQIAVAGMTDEEANRRGYRCECRVLPLTAVPRALVNHDTRGVVKIVADAATRRVLGVSIAAEGAGDVILAAVYAIKFGITVEQLAETWGPYLTMGEALKLAAQTFTRDVSKLSCCAA